MNQKNIKKKAGINNFSRFFLMAVLKYRCNSDLISSETVSLFPVYKHSSRSSKAKLKKHKAFSYVNLSLL
jgi:hypothetical protein